MKPRPLHATLLILTLLSSTPVMAEPPLPWEKDYAGALAKAKAEKRPLFLMLTATWCGPCKLLESQTLPSSTILSGLKEFVWVKAYEDTNLNERFKAGGYPTLVFLDSASEEVLERSTGYEPPGQFLRHVIAARKAAKLPLTKQMESLLAKEFKPDHNKIEGLIKSGDADGLLQYLAPARDDAFQQRDFLVAKLRLPPGIKPMDVQVTADFDHSVPDSGLLLFQVPREGKTAPLRILAPGCKAINEEIGVDEKSPRAVREFTLEPLSDKDAASFTGRVLGPDGHAIPDAIVRVCDWAVTSADGQGNFELARIAPGTFLVRGEAPGAEFQEEITFAAGQALQKDISLKAVTTVGIRWALQGKEGSRELIGESVRTGKAYFSVEHGRFLLSRGAEIPNTSEATSCSWPIGTA